jgi:succinoglycan biosynthesis protein ExoA
MNAAAPPRADAVAPTPGAASVHAAVGPTGTPGLLTVIAPCRNERGHVLAFCDAVAAQRLPDGWTLQVLIADGRSEDGTRELLAERSARDARFGLVDNPQHIVSTGLNACLAQARGAVVARLDLHTRYADDYLAECLAALARSGADNVGGPWRAEGGPRWQGAIAAAFQCRWVVGGARSRDIAYEGPVDTVYLGCWPRASFERFGMFDEALVRNQDDEHNLRLVRGGGRVWQSARIRSLYAPRADLGRLFHQQRQYGYWKAFVMRKHGQAASLRQLVPGAFVAALALLAVAAVAWPAARGLLAGLFGGYAVYLAIASFAAVRHARANVRSRRAHEVSNASLASAAGHANDADCQPGGPPSTRAYRASVAPSQAARGAMAALPAPRDAHEPAPAWRLLPRLPIVIAAFHLGYGLGTLAGWRDVLLRGRPSPAFAGLTR